MRKLVIAALLIVAAIAWWRYNHRPQPCPAEPLKVEIVDDGGADLKVSSTVDCGK